jgi:DNA-binding NtrC family response regulator
MLRECIRRAAAGEFVRWDTPIYGRAGGKETIIIDASLMPVKDEQGNVVYIAAGAADGGSTVYIADNGSARGAEALLVALTGWGQVEDKRRAMEAGFDEHLTKPVDPEFLRMLLAVERVIPQQ